MTSLRTLTATTREDWKQAGTFVFVVGVMIILGGLW